MHWYLHRKYIFIRGGFCSTRDCFFFCFLAKNQLHPFISFPTRGARACPSMYCIKRREKTKKTLEALSASHGPVIAWFAYLMCGRVEVNPCTIYLCARHSRHLALIPDVFHFFYLKRSHHCARHQTAGQPLRRSAAYEGRSSCVAVAAVTIKWLRLLLDQPFTGFHFAIYATNIQF